MSANEHTPGPWTLEYVERGAFQVIEADGAVICHRNFWPHNAERSNANARLIAAAPDMLEALKTIGALLAGRTKTIKDDELWGAFSHIIAAVAKAENTTPLNAEGGDK